MCFRSGSHDNPNEYAYRPAGPQQYNDPWQGPPGYVSKEANRWKGPLGRRKYESDVNKYGIVEADKKAKKRRRRGVAAAVSAGAGGGA